MIFDMLRWWYVSGWLLAIQRIATWTKGVERTFSLVILLQTLFSPWKRIVTFGAKGLDAKFRAMLDNFISSCVGFVVRLFVIVGALVAMTFVFVCGVIVAVIWPLLPLTLVGAIVKAVIG